LLAQKERLGQSHQILRALGRALLEFQSQKTQAQAQEPQIR